MYKKLLQFFEIISEGICRYFLGAVFSVIFVLGLFIRAWYSFDDYPIFSPIGIYDILSFVIVAVFLFVLVYFRDFIQGKIGTKGLFTLYILYAIVGVLFVYFVPLIPFSDMKSIYQGALNFSTFNMDAFYSDPYWNQFPGNMRLAIIWGILMIPFPKVLLSFKIINIIITCLLIEVTRRLALSYGLKYDRVVTLLMMGFLPFVLYLNHIYYDVPLILVMTMALYAYKKNGNVILSCALIGCALYIRKSASIYALVILVVYLLDNREMFENKTAKRVITRLVISLVLVFMIGNVAKNAVNNAVIGNNYKTYPGWNQIYIGLNEDRLGFMDRELSYDRSLEDVIERVSEYGPKRTAALIAKKTFWLWSSGTFQAERYGFGNDLELWGITDPKFERETFITPHVEKSSQILRKAITSFMRVEYMAVFFLMVFMMVKLGESKKFREFYYIIILTFLILTIYELKSRYIIHLYPLMLIMGGYGMEYLPKFTKKKD